MCNEICWYARNDSVSIKSDFMHFQRLRLVAATIHSSNTVVQCITVDLYGIDSSTKHIFLKSVFAFTQLLKIKSVNALFQKQQYQRWIECGEACSMSNYKSDSLTPKWFTHYFTKFTVDYQKRS